MSAGPEHDQPIPTDKPGMRAAWLGSRRVAVLAGVIAVGVLAGAGVAVAATSSPSSPTPTPSASPPTSAKPPFRALPPKGAWRVHGAFPAFGPAFGGPGMLGGLFGAVHGTVVVPKSGGGYQTVVFQNGKVTAVSSTSITLHSADGYSHTYPVTSSTIVNAQRDAIGSIKVGNQVMLAATVSGGTTTTIRIIDLTLLQQGMHRFFGAPPGANAKPPTSNT
jgi:hypothetical protein